MHQMSGLDFAAIAKEYTNIVFITSLPSVPRKAFASECFEYLPKPISYPRFLKCIERIRTRFEGEPADKADVEKHLFNNVEIGSNKKQQNTTRTNIVTY